MTVNDQACGSSEGNENNWGLIDNEDETTPLAAPQNNGAPSVPVGKCSNIALVAIDLQNDFLGEDPAFFMARRKSKLPGRRPELMKRVGALLEEVRSRGGHVVFVKSVYGDVPADEPRPYPHKSQRDGLDFNTPFHSGTHAGKKEECCARGTEGAELCPEALALIRRQDVVLEKNYYSAFAETTLHPLLQRLDVSHLVVCGVTANNCVTATVKDAFHLGYDVVLPPDGVAQANSTKERQTLDALSPYCAAIPPGGSSLFDAIKIIDTGADTQNTPRKGKLVFDGTKRISGIGAGDTILIENFLDKDDADSILSNMLSPDSEVEWNQLTSVRHQTAFPRLTGYQSDRNERGRIPAYRCADPQPWHGQYQTQQFSPFVRRLKSRIEKVAGQSFNWSRILCYRDRKDGMGFHSDKVLDIRDGSYIASLSLGQERTYELKPKSSVADGSTSLLAPQKITLRHNTLLLLGPETNRLFLHSVKKTTGSQKVQPRISITFRDLATWYVGNNNGDTFPEFYGQGTVHETYNDLIRAKELQSRLEKAVIAAGAGLACVLAARQRRDAPTGSGWIGGALAAGVTAASGSLFLQWKKHRRWRRRQDRLAKVYQQCNVQPLTALDAKELLLHATPEELRNAGNVASRSSKCERDS